MARPSEAARRIAEFTKGIEAKTDELLSKLDGVSQKIPGAFARGHAVIDQHSEDIDAMDAELRQLSNLPLGS